MTATYRGLRILCGSRIDHGSDQQRNRHACIQLDISHGVRAPGAASLRVRQPRDLESRLRDLDGRRTRAHVLVSQAEPRSRGRRSLRRARGRSRLDEHDVVRRPAAAATRPARRRQHRRSRQRARRERRADRWPRLPSRARRAAGPRDRAVDRSVKLSAAPDRDARSGRDQGRPGHRRSDDRLRPRTSVGGGGPRHPTRTAHGSRPTSRRSGSA